MVEHVAREQAAAHAVAAAWQREMPGAATSSLPAIWLAKSVASRLRRTRERTLRELGIDGATLDLLSTLRRAGDPYALTTRELAMRCLVTAGAVSQRVARAEREGLVERRPGAGRSVDVLLTAAGHELVERSALQVLEADTATTAGLDPSELADLERLLARWLDSMPEG
ncbi:MarR family winged helix-turn-helix transcriptional regulator [Pseudactinotalea terrae]|uniref:MarR family winged helix-turn-helix transcriptional regulator n=1 Tax=Pseudactinotalea terrae TaxID=1743262 RepID=UPI0012E29D94|nr:MarR family transcriptional regulator [Pseudactinotalea terrae]